MRKITRAALRDRPHPARRRRRAPASARSCGAAGRSTRRARPGGAAREARALVTLAHPAARRHAARAARARRRGAAPRLGAALRVPGAASAARRDRHPARARTAIVPGLGALAPAGGRARAAPTSLRLARAGARRRRALLDARSRRSRTATSRAGCARVPQVVHVYSSYGERASVSQALARPRASRDRAVGRLARAWREQAVGGFAPGRARPRRLQRHGRRADRARGGRAAAGRAAARGRPARRHGREPRLAEEPGAAGRGDARDPRRGARTCASLLDRRLPGRRRARRACAQRIAALGLERRRRA